MNSTIKNILIGTLAAIMCTAIIILAIEEKKSFFQILTGFLLFVFPFTFISSFNSKIGAFIFVIATIMTTYFVSKFLLYDFWFGVLLAGIIGGSAFFFRVNPYKLFSPKEYKKSLTERNKSSNNAR
jgi:hypothetical protein